MSDDLVPLKKATFLVFDSSNPGTEAAIRKAAQRLDALTTDRSGRASISMTVAEAFRRNWREFGHLTPRNCASIRELLEAK